MRMQLSLLPHHYYNTLGFNPELIVDVDQINDSFLETIIDPLFQKKTVGQILRQVHTFVCCICTIRDQNQLIPSVVWPQKPGLAQFYWGA